jgi:hypothetical protein
MPKHDQFIIIINNDKENNSTKSSNNKERNKKGRKSREGFNNEKGSTADYARSLPDLQNVERRPPRARVSSAAMVSKVRFLMPVVNTCR